MGMLLGMLNGLKGSVNRWWVISYLGYLHPAWPPVKPKSSSKVVSRNKAQGGNTAGFVGWTIGNVNGQCLTWTSLGPAWLPVKLSRLWARKRGSGDVSWESSSREWRSLAARSLACSLEWCGLYLSSWSLLELWGRVLRWERLGRRVGLGGTESRG